MPFPFNQGIPSQRRAITHHRAAREHCQKVGLHQHRYHCQNYHANCSTSSDDSPNMTLILCSVIPSIVAVLSIVSLILMVQRGIICSKRKSNQNIIVHKNDLYGSITNEDYFDDRYETKITDENQYYEEDYEESKL